jgi:hypothetical protein
MLGGKRLWGDMSITKPETETARTIMKRPSATRPAWRDRMAALSSEAARSDAALMAIRSDTPAGCTDVFESASDNEEPEPPGIFSEV